MFFVVKKPIGVSSNLVAKILKRVLKRDRVGFAWTLDPLATGLMIVGTDGSTRLFPLIEDFTKKYRTTIRLDGTTSSYDLEEPIQKLDIPEMTIGTITQEYIESILRQHFYGEIMQVPPAYSAVWIDGQRAYDLVRKGHNVEIKAKKRVIHEFQIISYTWPTLVLDIVVSHGTYIRSIARDLWLRMGIGGYLEKLERLSIGHIDSENIRWLQHNDILYAELSHEKLFPNISVLNLTAEQKTHLRLGSTPLVTNQQDGHYFVVYEDSSYGLLEAKWWLLFPIKNAV
jgi:tRNA pseudouridine55 synthase